MEAAPNPDRSPALLVLAAGMGSRYGGLKQIDPVGPGGETLLEYSVYDALRAGFSRIVFVIRRDIESEFREAVGGKFEAMCEVRYAFQELSDLPDGFSVPEGRTKPWGTTQAILAAEGELDRPFAAINADDFYGPAAFRLLCGHLASGSNECAMVGYVLRQTLSPHGTVARGVCRLSDGHLASIEELTRIAASGSGAVYTDESGAERRLSGDETVSMNFWGAPTSIFRPLGAQFEEFLRESGGSLTSEFYIPAAVNKLVQTGSVRVRVYRTEDPWFGVTYKEDRPAVVEGIRRLVDAGLYPERLWA